MKIGIIGMGHPFASQYKALKDLGYEIVLCDIDYDKMKNYDEDKYIDYKDLLHKVDVVLISTPPKCHYDLVKYFLENGLKVICEKPLVVKQKDLIELNNLVNNNFYNILHFSFGEEVNWFLNNNIYGKSKRIEVFINDPYIDNMNVREEVISLSGAYLDETINPLSAIKRIFNEKITFLDVHKEYSKNNIDYIANSKFLVGDIEVFINVSWNDENNREKYMDLYFEDQVIRLDSYNVKVIDLTNNVTLFKSNNNRMYMHYYNGFKNLTFINKDWVNAFEINKSILEGMYD